MFNPWQSLTVKALLLTIVGLGSANGTIAQESPTAPTCNDVSAKCLYEQDKYRLDRLSQNCREQKKAVQNMTYRICRINGKIVTASESLTTEGDGMGYWFEQGKVSAIVYFHDGTMVTFKGGKVTAVYENGGSDRSTKPTALARKQFELAAANGYQSIFKQFGNR